MTDSAVARARVWAKVIGIVVGALVPAWTAYQFAAIEARAAAAKVAASTVDLAVKTAVDSQATKNEAEAGYQVLLKEVEALRAEKAARERAAQPRHRRRSRPSTPAVPLPTDLKKAEQAVSAAAPPPAVTAPSAVAGSARPDAGP